MAKKKVTWEWINESKSMGLEVHTYRMKVYGGWALKVVIGTRDARSANIDLCFISDPEHKWEIK